MELYEYQQLAKRTTNAKLDFNMSLTVAALGLVGEGAEVSEMVKKTIGHGHELNVDKIRKELGDTLWYIAEISNILELDLNEIAKQNIEKLKARYPEGFSEYHSIFRGDDGA
jgi:NTP pyrophosphatase (non-canonical NTP hydrolase)